MAQMDGAKLVRYDPDGYVHTWHGGTGVHVYDASGTEVHYYSAGTDKAGRRLHRADDGGLHRGERVAAIGRPRVGGVLGVPRMGADAPRVPGRRVRLLRVRARARRASRGAVVRRLMRSWQVRAGLRWVAFASCYAGWMMTGHLLRS